MESRKILDAKRQKLYLCQKEIKCLSGGLHLDVTQLQSMVLSVFALHIDVVVINRFGWTGYSRIRDLGTEA